MKNQRKAVVRNRQRAVVAAVAVLAVALILTPDPASGDNNDATTADQVCPEGSGWSSHQTGNLLNQPWGSATKDNSTVTFQVNDSWKIDVCVKGGPGYTLDTITGPTTKAVRTPEHPMPGMYPEVSHWSYKITGTGPQLGAVTFQKSWVEVEVTEEDIDPTPLASALESLEAERDGECSLTNTDLGDKVTVVASETKTITVINTITCDGNGNGGGDGGGNGGGVAVLGEVQEQTEVLGETLALTGIEGVPLGLAIGAALATIVGGAALVRRASLLTDETPSDD